MNTDGKFRTTLSDCAETCENEKAVGWLKLYVCYII